MNIQCVLSAIQTLPETTEEIHRAEKHFHVSSAVIRRVPWHRALKAETSKSSVAHSVHKERSPCVKQHAAPSPSPAVTIAVEIDVLTLSGCQTKRARSQYLMATPIFAVRVQRMARTCGCSISFGRPAVCRCTWAPDAWYVCCVILNFDEK